MAKFTIYSPSGTALYEGTPTYSGTYMEPGQLVFRNVASPFPIDFPIGSYVDYSILDDEDVQVRTGERYKLYSSPALTKQARQETVGNAFVYDSIVLYDAPKMLEFCPFRDYVTSDNNIHFSTQPSWSTFEDVEGIRKRIQANVDNMYPDEHWSIEIATRLEVYTFYYYILGKSVEDANQLADEYEALITEAREYSFSGGSVLDALKRIYEVWKELGWRYTSAVDGLITYKKIRIGPPGVGIPPTSTLYGKGNGLKSLKRSIANEDELCNRIYPFGNSTNVSREWYRKLLFLGRNTADIQHLMLPYADWGVVPSGGVYVKSPTMAFLEDTNSIARNGLRPKYVYFDGSDDLDDIFPTIKKLTVQDIRDYIASGGSVDYPPASTTLGTQRLDIIQNVNADGEGGTTFDAGLTGEDGRKSIKSVKFNSSGTGSATASTTQGDHTGSFSLGQAPYITVSSDVPRGSITLTFANLFISIKYDAYLIKYLSADLVITVDYSNGGVSTTTTERIPIPKTSSREGLINLSDYKVEIPLGQVGTSEQIEVAFEIEYTYHTGVAVTQDGITIQRTINTDVGLTFELLKTWGAIIPPFGFDLTDIVATEDKVRIKMTSGKCAGREFVVTGCDVMAPYTDTLYLYLNRQLDESLSQYFPNTDYPVVRGDEFVILGIAMPDFYVEANAQRLKTAAQKYLDTYSREIWQYAPEIDPKYMAGYHGRILPGQYMKIIDPDIVAEEEDGKIYLIEHENKYMLTAHDQYIVLNDGTGGVAAYIVVDSISIDESGALPSWRVTLRNRKRVPKYDIVSAEVVQLGRKKGDLIIKR